MPDSGIFLKVGDRLELLRPSRYDKEDVLQKALADYPEVIAGLTTEGEIRPLVLVSREIGIPGTQLSLDHLFLDDEGVPVLVEVKRATDTRIRREVVAQMLDYAANAVVAWPVTFLREQMDKTLHEVAAQISADDYIAQVAGDADPDDFWQRVESNLAARRMRLLFVADEIPESLERIIDFLNSQMSPAEVLGIEVRQYVAEGHTAYVPQVVGRSATAIATKQAGRGQRWTEDAFLAEADKHRSPAVASLIRRLLEHVKNRDGRLSWGSGATPGVGGWYDVNGRPTGVWAVNAGDSTYKAVFTLYLGDLVTYGNTQDVVDLAADLAAAVPAMKVKLDDAKANSWAKYPQFQLDEIAAEQSRVDGFIAALTTFTNKAQGTSSEGGT